MTPRALTPDDMTAAKSVIDAVDLFPSEMLDDMIDFDAMWLTQNGQSVAYAAPEPMADGTSNLYLIAVHPDHQSKGLGQAMMDHVETKLGNEGVRVLLVETSGKPEFERTRSFYEKRGYTREATIRDFYAAGDDKVIFRKALQPEVA